MRITADTNVLVRAAVRDHLAQARSAAEALAAAEVIAVTLPSLCEFVWVLRKVYGFAVDDVAIAIRTLLAAGNVEVDRQGAEAGLKMLEAGGDFADGVIAYEGRWLGGEVFVSFDRKAIARLKAQGHPARMP